MEGRKRYLRRGGQGQAKQLSEAAAAAEESDGGVRRGEGGRRVRHANRRPSGGGSRGPDEAESRCIAGSCLSWAKSKRYLGYLLAQHTGTGCVD